MVVWRYSSCYFVSCLLTLNSCLYSSLIRGEREISIPDDPIESEIDWIHKEIKEKDNTEHIQTTAMKSSWLLWALSLVSTVSTETTITTPPPVSPLPTSATPFSPFHAPLKAEPQKRAFEVLQILNKRVANECPSGYNPCSTLDNPKICCRNGSRCARDAADNIACCPTGASCTGSLFASTTDTSSFMFPQYATGAATSVSTTQGAIATGSTMPGAYPFIYVPTTFSDAMTCSAYYTKCESEYAQCTASLGSGSNGQWGVTVGGDGGAGVTIQGGGAEATASACSSLQLEACHGLNLGYCNSYNSGQQNSGNAGSPGKASSPQDLIFGVIVAVAGMFI